MSGSPTRDPIQPSSVSPLSLPHPRLPRLQHTQQECGYGHNCPGDWLVARAKVVDGEEALDVVSPAFQEARDKRCFVQGEVVAAEGMAGEKATPRLAGE